jgi:L-lactate dehydrogenase
MTNIAGMTMDNYCPVCNGCTDWNMERKKIEQQVRESAYHIINAKGSTHFAVGLALVRITAAVLRKENSIMTVSVLLKGEFGIDEVCLSVPSVVTGSGAVKIINAPLPPDELELLRKSAAILREAINSLS